MDASTGQENSYNVSLSTIALNLASGISRLVQPPEVGDSLQIFVRVVAGVDKRGPSFLYAPNGHTAVQRAAGTTLFYGIDLL